MATFGRIGGGKYNDSKSAAAAPNVKTGGPAGNGGYGGSGAGAAQQQLQQQQQQQQQYSRTGGDGSGGLYDDDGAGEKVAYAIDQGTAGGAGGGGGDAMDDLQALVDYYCTIGYYWHVQQVCTDATAKGDDSVARFWRGFALTSCGLHADAIREFDAVVGKPDLAMAATAALIATHKACDTKDKDTLGKHKDRWTALSKSANERSLVLAARYFWHAKKTKQAKQCIDKVLKKNEKHTDAITIAGWLSLVGTTARTAAADKKDKSLFDTALALVAPKRDLSALLGRSRWFEQRRKYDKALEDLTLIVVSFPRFTPALIEKARVLLIRGEWDEAVDTVQRVLKRDPSNIDALRVLVLQLLARDAKPQLAVQRIAELRAAVDRCEPKNAPLYYDLSRMVARLANRRTPLLQASHELLSRAMKEDPVNSAYLTESAFQMTLMGEFESAQTLYSEASKLDEANAHALHGSIKCKILMGNYDDADSELDFLTHTVQDHLANADLFFLGALLQWRKKHNEPKSVDLLHKAVETHLKALDDVDPGFDWYTAYNPDFMLELAREYMTHVGTEALQPGDPPNPLLHKVIDLLNHLVSFVPGNLGAHMLLANCKFLANDLDNAERSIDACLKLETQFAQAYIVQSQISFARGDFKNSLAALEQARSMDFEVHKTPLYHLLKAKLLQTSGSQQQLEEALKLLDTAMAIRGVRKPHAATAWSVQDRISLFLELAGVHAKLGQGKDAAKVMAEAQQEFGKTAEAARLSIADADLAVRRGDFEAALSTLRQIGPDSSYFTRAKMAMAEIYLRHRKNRRLYAACFQELANNDRTSVHKQLLLAEAYMKIQEPDKAIRAFETTLKLAPDDPNLPVAMGRALVATHDYARAVQYYEAAIKADRSKMYLFHELADLYLQLKLYDHSIKTLEVALTTSAQQQGLAAQRDLDDDQRKMAQDVKSYMILAEVRQGQQLTNETAQALMAALDLQKRVINGSGLSASQQTAKEQKDVAAHICFLLAEHYQKFKGVFDDKKNPNGPTAAGFFNDALAFNPNHEKSRLALAQLALQSGDLDRCQEQCITLLRADQHNKEASMMLADVMFRNNQHESATFHFQQLLEKHPTRYEALHKLILLLRRAGRLAEAPRFIKLAEKANAKASFSPGLHYCRGLYHWFANEPREALVEFNHARKDGEWGRESLQHMIEIYLNPDNQELFADAASASMDAKGVDNTDNLVAADKLLDELRRLGEGNAPKFVVLEAYALMAASKTNKSKLEVALKNVLNVLTVDREYVPALLASSAIFLMTKNSAKAKSQLKIIDQIAKKRFSPEYAHDFERAWLMLADLFIAIPKYDEATQYCKKCLEYNKSNAKAHELLGFICEKEQSFADAASNYENAWKFQSESSPAIGFKLAFNYLKAKRYLEAIDVCHKVLSKNPDYPRIQKEILDKARAALRP